MSGKTGAEGDRPARRAHVAYALAVVTMLAACGDLAPAQPRAPAFGTSLFAATADRHWGLPDRLKEVSGLAAQRDGRLIGHDDEKAVISVIDVNGGQLVKSFSLGDPALAGDFEGIAVGEDDAIYMINSTGRLYRFAEGENDAHVPFQTFETGLAPVCEIEGLAYHAAAQSLIIACKINHAKAMRKTVSLYAWSVATRTLAPEPWLTASSTRLAATAKVEGFHPSSVEIDPATGRVILLAAREGAMAELNPDGSIVAARRLDPSHNQAEGVAILPDGALVIADEGASGLRAGISRYPRRP